jgi:hypothetical protein
MERISAFNSTSSQKHQLLKNGKLPSNWQLAVPGFFNPETLELIYPKR